jgi:hypothetical protein
MLSNLIYIYLNHTATIAINEYKEIVLKRLTGVVLLP